jgi:hypothetical protein
VNYIGARQKYPITSLVNSVDLGTNTYWSAFSGPIGTLYANPPGQSGFWGAWTWFSPTSTYVDSLPLNNTESPGCSFVLQSGATQPSDFLSFIPSQDIFGTASTGYQTTTTSTVLGASRISVTQTNLSNAVWNLADNSATFARTSNALQGGAANSYPATQIFVVGLGGNGGVDHTLLQRIANDPNPSPDGTTYSACAVCGYSRGPVGTYIYSADSTELAAAFLKIASQIIRISK